MADLLSIATSGLNVSKSALETTGHNISNANTEGYSRQKVRQATGTPTVKNGLIQGTGAIVTDVSRYEDANLNKRLQTNISEHEFYKEKIDQMTKVETIFNEVDTEGLNKIINKFFNAFRQLANQPENETIRSVVRDNAQMVAKDFRRIRNTLDSIARGIDSKLDRQVEEINTHLNALSKINVKVAALEAQGQMTGDLRDQRDVHLRALSEFFEIHTYVDEKGNFNVNAKGLGTLVAAGEAQELMVTRQSKGASTNNMAGSAEIFFKARQNLPISNKFKKGRMSALLKTRNENIKNIQDKVDEIAFDLSNSVNAIHSRGFISKPVAVDKNGNVVENGQKVTGINFFRVPDEKHLAARFFDLSDDVKDDLGNIATAIEPNSPGDNRLALAVSKLQSAKIMGGGVNTIEEEFLQTVGNVGIEVGKARLDAEQSEGLLAQAHAIRERLVGVSIDEEAANLVRYQHAYEASAKVLSAADEMFDTILSIKR